MGVCEMPHFGIFYIGLKALAGAAFSNRCGKCRNDCVKCRSFCGNFAWIIGRAAKCNEKLEHFHQKIEFPLCYWVIAPNLRRVALLVLLRTLNNANNTTITTDSNVLFCGCLAVNLKVLVFEK